MLHDRTLVARSLILGLILASGAIAATNDASILGTKLDSFALADAYGKQHQLADYAKRPIVVLALVGTECPLAKLYAPRLAALAKKYEASGVTFLGVNS